MQWLQHHFRLLQHRLISKTHERYPLPQQLLGVDVFFAQHAGARHKIWVKGWLVPFSLTRPSATLSQRERGFWRHIYSEAASVRQLTRGCVTSLSNSDPMRDAVSKTAYVCPTRKPGNGGGT